jgi:aspartate carbamoyltransferase catalytic subunit
MKTKEISPFKHILESQQFNQKYLLDIFSTAKMMKEKNYISDELKGKIVAMLFYEPSTRTRLSFETAALRLGAGVIMTENAKEFSSASKGETLQDTIKVVSGYANFIVIRHSENDAAEKAASVSTVPILNAGAGTGQHPTQALLDVFTIYETFGRLENLNIALVGDLLRGRTVNSLVYIMSKFKGNKFYFISPDNCKVKDGLKQHLKEHNMPFEETEDMESILPLADIVYMTRVQKERFDDPKEYEKAKGKFILNIGNVQKMKETAIIMHPLPRIDEISADVDSDKRAKYFEQAKNGLFVRMAILKGMNEHNKK